MTSRTRRQASNTPRSPKPEPAPGHRPYFPMLLGNGVDAVLIGYTGSMGGGGSHEHFGYDNAVLTGWFKADRKGVRTGRLIHLLQAGHVLTRGVRADSIETFEQTFDAETAVLTTSCRHAGADVRVQAFLTDNHVLVHRFVVIPRAEGMTLQFYVKTPSHWWMPSNPQDAATVAAEAPSGQRALRFTCEAAGLKNLQGVLASDDPDARAERCFTRSPGLVVALRGVTRFTVAVQLLDDEDRELGATPLDPAALDVRALLRDHRKRWRAFNREGRVEFTERRDLQDLYDTSLYTVRAHQHPATGLPTVGNYPLMWSSDVQSFDASFCLMALLGSGRLEAAGALVRGWREALPHLRATADSAGFPGACFMRNTDCRGRCTVALPEDRKARRALIRDDKLFLTANLPIHVWMLYQYTGQRRILEEGWELMVETMAFFAAVAIREYPDHAEIVRSSGPNGKERRAGKSVHFPNPIRTLVAGVKALEAVAGAADVLQRPIPDAWRRLLPKLRAGMEVNRFGGFIRKARTPERGPGTDPYYHGLFDCLLDRRTARKEFQVDRTAEGLMRWSDHGYRVVPWLHFNWSAALSRMGDPRAASVLSDGAHFTTTLNALPEGVRPDGVFWKTGYPTCHASFVHALNLLLVRREGHTVRLFPGWPREWGDVAIHGLALPGGLRVDAVLRLGGGSWAEVRNDGDTPQRIRLRWGDAKPLCCIRLAPGASAHDADQPSPLPDAPLGLFA